MFCNRRVDDDLVGGLVEDYWSWLAFVHHVDFTAFCCDGLEQSVLFIGLGDPGVVIYYLNEEKPHRDYGECSKYDIPQNLDPVVRGVSRILRSGL